VIWRRTVLSGVAIAVAVVVIVLLDARRTSTHRGQIDSTSIVMLGDSITEQADWRSLLPDLQAVNQGHSGFTTEQLVPIARSIGAARPRAVLVLTGTNDIRDGRSPEWTASHLDQLLDALEQRSPDTTVIVQTVLPRSDHPADVIATNAAISAVAASRGLETLDLYEPFDDGAGGLGSDETTDGIHLSERGYRRWASLLAPLIASLDDATDADT
jgi:lysophospholipase L1-like esterase